MNKAALITCPRNISAEEGIIKFLSTRPSAKRDLAVNKIYAMLCEKCFENQHQEGYRNVTTEAIEELIRSNQVSQQRSRILTVTEQNEQ